MVWFTYLRKSEFSLDIRIQQGKKKNPSAEDIYVLGIRNQSPLRCCGDGEASSVWAAEKLVWELEPELSFTDRTERITFKQFLLKKNIPEWEFHRRKWY